MHERIISTDLVGEFGPYELKIGNIPHHDQLYFIKIIPYPTIRQLEILVSKYGSQLDIKPDKIESSLQVLRQVNEKISNLLIHGGTITDFGVISTLDPQIQAPVNPGIDSEKIINTKSTTIIYTFDPGIARCLRFGLRGRNQPVFEVTSPGSSVNRFPFKAIRNSLQETYRSSDAPVIVSHTVAATSIILQAMNE